MLRKPNVNSHGEQAIGNQTYQLIIVYIAKMLSKLSWLLPFANPGTPIVQDMIHLAAICLLLYFAPQIQQRVQAQRQNSSAQDANEALATGQQGEVGPGPNDVEIPDFNPEENAQVPNRPGPEGHDVLENLNHGNLPDVANVREGAGVGAVPGPSGSRGNVGAKKAKSLARKDQRRAYNEFMRSQGEAQRAKDAEGAGEREAALAAERERRRAVEREVEARKSKEREAKREREDRERREVARRTELVLETVQDELSSHRMCDLFRLSRLVGDDADEEWIEQVLKASSILGSSDGAVTMITTRGWVVRVTSEDMAALYKAAIVSNMGDEHGQISNEELGALLEMKLREWYGD